MSGVRLGVLSTHPIQYQAPLFRALAAEVDLRVYYAHRMKAEDQARSGFGVAFEWDVPLLEGYHYHFLENVAPKPKISDFHGCDTPEVERIIASNRFDAFLVMGWNNRAYWQAIRACWKARVPLMIRGDSQLNRPRPWWLRSIRAITHRAFIPRFDAYLYVGQRARQYYLAYGADPDSMYFVPHCVDNDRFRSRVANATARVGALRLALGAAKGTRVLLFVGKLIGHKRPGDLIRAASILQSDRVDIRVAFVGAGALERKLRREAQEESVSCHFAGFKNQSELPDWYAAADLLVLPSESETWGLVTNEAMACGRPIVVSEAVGCAPDLVEEGVTGAVFPVGDAQALAAAVQRVLPLVGSERSRQAIEEKMRVYSVQTAVGGVIRAIHSLTNQREVASGQHL